MSKVENLERILDEFGPHLHDEPDGGWQADRTIDKAMPFVIILVALALFLYARAMEKRAILR